MPPINVHDILEFWFEGIDDGILFDRGRTPFRKWFRKDPQFDQEIKVKYEKIYEQAKEDRFKEWEMSSQGRLALIILLDQFPRNMYRNTPQMFAADKEALSQTLACVAGKKDKELMLIERVFCYMPLMHAEDPEMQERSVQYYRQLVETAGMRKPDNSPYFEYTLQYAVAHRDIIARFGRFPHRNFMLQRESTSEEKEFLETSPGF